MPLDIGVGLMLGVLLHANTAYSYAACLTVGVLASLLPDVDYIWRLLFGDRSPDTSHRDMLHYPLLFTPVVGIIGLLFSNEVGLTLVAGSLAHFIHDSFGVGFGVKWLYPFNKKSYMFLFQASTPANKDMPKQLVYVWDDDQRAHMIKKYGYKHWIRYVYFRPHPFGIFEYAVLVLGIILAISDK